MLATHAATRFDTLRPSIVRVHEMPAEVAEYEVAYAPAMSFHQQVTAQDAIDALRQMPAEMDSIYYLFVTDAGGHLVGTVSLRQLIVAPPGARLFEFMDRLLTTLSHTSSMEEQMRLMAESGLMALPVVDEQGKLVGAMDMSDLIAAVEQETNREMCHLTGISKHERVERPFFETLRDRALWLIINLAPLFLVAWVITLFDSLLSSAVIVAAFLPMVAGLSSRAGMQTLGLTMRSLTLGTIIRTNARQVLAREVMVGLVNGLIIGILVGIVGWLWQGNGALSALVSLTILVSLPVAALVGMLIPLAFKRFYRDPSLASTTLVTLVTDILGFCLLLGLGTILLQLGYL